jgi:hypothetical protein
MPAVLNSLKLQADMISLEAFGGGNSMASAMGRLPEFIDTATAAFNKSVADPKNEILPIHYSKLARKLADLKYDAIANVQVMIPPGLKVTYLDHIKNFEATRDLIEHLRRDVLVPFGVWVNLKLSNPSQLSSVAGGLDIHGLVLPDTKKAAETLLEGVNPSVHQTQVSYKAVVKRNADWPVIENKLEELNNVLMLTEQKRLVGEVRDLTESLDKLITRIQEQPDDYNVSPGILSLFAKTCYGVAKALEFYSVYAYQLKSLTVAVQDTQKILETFVQHR